MNHIQAMLNATHTTFGVTPKTGDDDATTDSQPSTLQGFVSKPPAAGKAKRTSGATTAALAQLVKGDWWRD